jgi:hypothetical protein
VFLVPITLEMTPHGALRVSVGEVPDPSRTGVEEELDPSHVYVLAAYCLGLFALYIGLKLYFSDIRVGWTKPPGDGADGSGPLQNEL